ncbi:bifunctional copper resistance protein CopD/cytochrome c oxidase assembly protein [Georgenia sp. H159]|uniref:bifunctional copper resistance protein CopD/cytochrome c oxidase assembly protein n=1 Tax=Georgenia sp. H159 TaxID=3076115 RepID=UPI002D7A104C|nr:bifunctional copper resistance protein CopD/cytochrome c oxidase assembly protein [Georgenia sp. H159]
MTTSPSRLLRPALGVPLAVAAAGAALVLGLVLSGAVAPTGVLDPGALVRWGVPVVTVLADGAAAVTIGALALCAVVLPAAGRTAPTRRERRARVAVDGTAWRLAARTAAVASVVWTLAGVLRIVLSYSRTSGRRLDEPAFGSELAYFITDIPLGRAYLVAALLTALLATVCVAVATPTGAALACLLALASLVPIALTGHAAGAADHGLAVSSLWLHIGSMSLWVGGLGVLCLVGSRLGVDRVPAVVRYSTLAGWAFALVGVSGLANGWVRVGSLAGLATPYGQLVLVKAAAFAALAVVGWLHRRRTVPRVGERPGLFWRVALGEVVLMAAVIGVSVALASSPPPVPQEPPARPTPVQEVTGYPAPPEPTFATWFTEWRIDILFALAAVAAVAVYVSWVVRLRRRGDHWSVPRTASWVAGAVLFGWVTSGGPAVYGLVLFSAHMVQHMLLAMVIPLFFVVGAPITLAMRALPARSDGSRGPREWLLALVHSRWAQFFARPGVAAINFAGSMVVFYYSPLFAFSLNMDVHIGHVLMVVHFTLAGYLFANALIGIDPGPTRPSYPLRLVLLFATMAFHAFFGISILQSTTLFAADHFGRLGLPWWVDALADQEVGGAVTWGIGELPTLALAVAVAIAWARDEDRTARREDRQADRDDDAALAAYNARLAQLADHDGAR